MKNRSLVITLTVAYAGLVCGAIALGSPANLLGSTLNFFSEPAAIEQLDSFDVDDNAVPDFINAERILEIFVSSPQWLTPLLGQPMRMPGMIRIDERFFTMSGDHTAAPATFSEEDYPAFDVVEPLWTSDTIQLSPEFEGGESPAQAMPTPFLVPVSDVQNVTTRTVPISPSSSLPASLMMPMAPTAPSSTPPSVTAPPSSTPPVTSAPPAVVPVTATASTSSVSSIVENCSNGVDDNSDGFEDCDDIACMSAPACISAASSSVSTIIENCSNGVDDNSDGMMDCDDSACIANVSCVSSSAASF